MPATILSLAFALFLVFYSQGHAEKFNSMNFAPLIAILSLCVWVVGVIIYALAWMPLQKAEQNLTPRILELFKKDATIRLSKIFLFLFPLMSFALAIDLAVIDFGPKSWVLAIWVLLFGAALDTIRFLAARILGYINPFAVVNMFSHAAKSSIQTEKEMDLCEWLDSLSEVAVKSLDRSSSSLCSHAVDEMEKIIKNFLGSQKSIGHSSQDAQSQEMGITDKVSYTLFFLFQRLEMINEKAVELKLEPICSKIVTSLGKIVIHAAKYDISLATYPIYAISQVTQKALAGKIPDIGVKASLTLLEVAKEIIQEVDLTYVEIKDPYFSITSDLDEIAKETFRQDKNTSISVLTQPFKDLKELFKNPRVANHQDTPAILENIDRVLAEFSALEMVMRSLPPLPNIPETSAAPPPEPFSAAPEAAPPAAPPSEPAP